MIRLLFAFILAIILAPNDTHAQDLDESSVFKALSGKTFWNKSDLDRYSFLDNGDFKQQFTSQKGEYSAGTILTGQWTTKEETDEVCWTYDQGSLSISGQLFCFQYELDEDAPRIWGAYDQTTNLYSANTNGEKTLSFEWDRWMDGDLILEPEIAATVNDKIIEMTKMKIRLNKQMADQYFPFNENAPLTPEMQTYTDAIIGNVIKLPLSHILHTADGHSYTIAENLVAQVNDDPSLVQNADFINVNNIKTGEKWFINGNMQCWFYETTNASICNAVYPAQLLDSPKNGYVQILEDGFIRLIETPD